MPVRKFKHIRGSELHPTLQKKANIKPQHFVTITIEKEETYDLDNLGNNQK